jgi:hypothetical protein
MLLGLEYAECLCSLAGSPNAQASHDAARAFADTGRFLPGSQHLNRLLLL